MKKVIFAVLMLSSIGQAFACTYPWDTAADGSRCGGRASTIRPGGK